MKCLTTSLGARPGHPSPFRVGYWHFRVGCGLLDLAYLNY